jgi:uncharacterized repeat protein (TIGR03803 family)
MKTTFSIFLMFFMACGLRAQSFTTLWSFGSTNEGGVPELPLVAGPDGKFFGTATDGGTNYNGTVFAINQDGSGFTNLYTFSAGGFEQEQFEYTNSDGMSPYGLALSGDVLYGVAENGGTNGNGTLFSLKTDGTGFTTLYTFSPSANDQNFTSTNSDGVAPSDLIVSGQTLYGTAFSGGTNGDGTLFALNTNGSGFTVLHRFGGSDGANPNAGLLLAGNTFYGSTQHGGANGNGTLFSASPDGNSFSNLYTFSASANNGNYQFTNSDGATPLAGLILSGAYLYGTTDGGGTNGSGTVFALNTNGNVLTTLYTFANGTDGAYPEAALVQFGRNLFGTTSSGGAYTNGTIFALHTDGSAHTNLYAFSATANDAAAGFNPTNSDGTSPQGGLIVSGNTLYGTAANGGANGEGTIFSLSIPPAYIPSTLRIQVSAGSLVISWPAVAAGSTLMTAPDLAATTIWSVVSTPRVVANGFNTVTITITGQQAFYYLSQ